MQTQTRTVALLAAFALSLAVPSSAEAQFGGLIKKAKEKAAEKAVEKAVEKGAEKVGPVAPGEQLTEELLAKVITGAEAADKVLDQRDRINFLRDAQTKELSALTEKNQPVHQAYDEASNKIYGCRSSSFETLSRAREERYETVMEAKKADPAFSGKLQLISMKYAKQMSDAQQKNDPVALQKVQTEMMNEIVGFNVFADIKKDSVATDAKCGKMPAKPAALVQEEKLQKGVAAKDDSLRTLEASAVNTGARASGLEQVRYLQLKERALSILGKVSGGGGAKYGEEEIAAVTKRQADLEKVKRAL